MSDRRRKITYAAAASSSAQAAETGQAAKRDALEELPLPARGPGAVDTVEGLPEALRAKSYGNFH